MLDLVSRGLTNKEIALQLGITETTVKNTMTSAMRKLGVRNRVQAAMAYDMGKWKIFWRIKWLLGIR